MHSPQILVSIRRVVIEFPEAPPNDCRKVALRGGGEANSTFWRARSDRMLARRQVDEAVLSDREPKPQLWL